MNTIEIKQAILSNAEEIRELHSRIHQTVKHRDESSAKQEAWAKACRILHERYDKLAFPGGWQDRNPTALQRIVAGDHQTMEAAICFLEVRPYFFRSGYMFWDILRKAKKAPLSAEQSERLKVILANVEEWRRRKQEVTSRPGYKSDHLGRMLRKMKEMPLSAELSKRVGPHRARLERLLRLYEEVLGLQQEAASNPEETNDP